MPEVKQRMETDFSVKHSLKPASAHWLSGIPLPVELHTGHKAIDFEHAQLLACMQTLRAVCNDFSRKEDCAACSQEKREGCEDSLVGLLGDLLAFIIDHFKTEELAMRDSLLMAMDAEVCQAHMEDHANISAKVQEIIMALEPLKTVGLLRELNGLLELWIKNHIQMHDALLGRWLESHGKPLELG